MNIHDSGYKFLFSIVAFFRQLLETFVEEAWVKQLDFSRATLLDKSFVSADYEESEADLLWQVPLKGATSLSISTSCWNSNRRCPA